MQIKDFITLPTLYSSTDTYPISRSLSNFDIPFCEEGNTLVTFETVMSEGDGYRGAWIQRIMYKKRAIGITYQEGRSGNDGYGYFVLEPKLFKEMVEYLREVTREQDDHISIEDDSEKEFSELYGYDINKTLNNINFTTTLNIGDYIQLDIKDIDDSLEEKNMPNLKCKILKIDLHSDYKTFQVEAVGLRVKPLWFLEPYERKNPKIEHLHSIVVPTDSKFTKPSCDNPQDEWTVDQHKVLDREIKTIKHPKYDFSYAELLENNIPISKV